MKGNYGKRFLSLMLASIMVLGMLPVNAFADTDAHVLLTKVDAPEVTAYEAEVGTALDALGLPETLAAVTQVTTQVETEEVDENNEPIYEEKVIDVALDVAVVWTGYDAESLEAQTLTASAEHYDLAEGVEWPEVTVTLFEAASEEEEVTEEPAGEEITEPIIDEAVAEVQAMIDELPTEFETEEEVDAFWAAADEIEAAKADLSDDQLEQLDESRYNEAMDAAAAFYNEEFENAGVWATSGDGWYWDGTTLYIKDGSMTKGKLYSALSGKFGDPVSSTVLKGYYYGNKYTNTTSASDTAAVTFEHNASIEIWKTTKSSWGAVQTSQGSITVKYYYVVTVDTDPAGVGGATYDDTSYDDGDEFNFIKGNGAITLNAADGYGVPSADGVGVNPTESGTLIVKYPSLEAAKHKVTLNIVNGEYAKATPTLSASGDVAEGTVVTISNTAALDKTASVGYSVDVSVDGATLNGSTFTVGESDVVVTVVYSKDAFELAEGPYEISISGYDNAAKAAGLKKAVLDEVIGGNYNADDYEVRALTKIDLGLWSEEIYCNVEGETVYGYDIDPAWLVTQLKVDGVTENNFKITKLAKANESGVDLYHEDVMIVASESRDTITEDDVTLEKTAYTENTLNDMINSIKNNLRVNGEAVDTDYITSVTLTPETALTTTETAYTATVVLESTPDYIVADDLNTFTFDVTGTVKTYIVTWKLDGEEFKTETLPYGTAITAPAVDEKTGYTFSGWGDVAATVTGNVTYSGTYEINKYTITWVNGEETTTTEVAYNEMPVAPEAYKAPKTDDAGTVIETYVGTWPTLETVTGEATYTATFETVTAKYTITFKNGDTVLQSTEVAYGETPEYTGETPTKAEDEQNTYTFNGWDKEIVSVTGAATYTAQFKSNNKHFVAQVGDNRYTTLAKAVEAANAIEGGATVTLLDDLTVGEMLDVSGNVTIDGAYTITWADGYNGTLFNVAEGASLELTDVTIDGKNEFTFYNDTTTVEDGQNWYTRFVNVGAEDKAVTDNVIVNAGNLTLDGTVIKNVTIASDSGNGKTKNTETGGYYLMYNDDLAIINSTAGTVTMDGAEIIGNAGMVLNADNTTTVLENAKVEYNMFCGRNGGGFDLVGDTMTITDSSISYNKGMARCATIIGVTTGAVVTMEGNSAIDNNKHIGVGSNTAGSMIVVREGSKFVMNGGSISNNVGGRAGAIASRWATTEAMIELNAGTIAGNKATNDSWNGASIFLRSPATIGEGMTVEGTIAVNAAPGALEITGGNFTNFDLVVTDGLPAEISGGTFEEKPTEYVASGHAAKDNGDGTYTVFDYVKEIQAKLLAGDDVTLEHDIVITDYEYVHAHEWPSNGNGKYNEVHGNGAIFHIIEEGVVLDLNGHSITWDAHDDAYCNKRQVSLFMVTATGNEGETADFTVTDSVGGGKVDVYGMATGVYTVLKTAKATIEGGTWTNYPCNTCEASNIFLYPSHGGTMEITGGTFEQKDSEYLLGWKGSTKETTESDVGVDFDSTKVVITGGTFVNFDPEKVKFFDNAGSADAPETINGCADGYASEDNNGDGTYGVIEMPFCLITFVLDNGEEDVECKVYIGRELADDQIPVPTKAGYVFAGWDKEVNKTPTEEGTVTYTAQWGNDTNNNGVADVNETITITVNKAKDADAITVTGAENIEGTNDYVFDFKNAPSVTITATPVLDGDKSVTYVASVTGVEGTGAYGDKYVYTLSFNAENGNAVVVNFAEAGFTYTGEVMKYYDGMKNVAEKDLYDTIISDPAYDEAYATDDGVTITYKAREAMTHKIPVASLKLGDDWVTTNVIKPFLMGSTIEGVLEDGHLLVNMEDLWLPVDVENKEPFPAEQSIPLDQAVNKFLEENNVVSELIKLVGANLTTPGNLGDVLGEFFAPVTNSAVYYGAHRFGYNATGAETVTEEIKITYANDKMYIEGETTVELKDTRLVTTIEGNNVTLMYKDYTDEELLAAINAHVVEFAGAEVTCEQITDEFSFEGMPVAEAANVLKFKFAGNDDYRPSEATFTVTITKAPAAIDIPNVIVTYGDDYSVDPEVTLGNKYGEAAEVTDSLIQFVVGLDIADLDVDGDGVKGLEGRVQLILPAEMLEGLTGIPGIGDKIQEAVDKGLELSLSQLMEYLQYLDGESMDSLKQALEAIQGIVETADLKITLGGQMPEDIGAYLYGAVSTNPNYETAFDVAYILIKPDAERVYLDWNYSDTNGIYTPELLQHVNLGASAYADEAFATLNEAATAQINNLFFGLDINGELVAELFNKDVTDPEELENKLDNGAYTQLAFIAEFGNEFYYAVPIVRAFVIIPNTVEVNLVGDTGNNRQILREFNNEQQEVEFELSYDGSAIELDEKWLKVEYTGLQTNTQAYETTTDAPTHAGAYLVTATYIQKDETTGEIIAIGANAAVLVIAPAESTINVEDVVIEDADFEGQKISDLLKITVDSLTSDVTPDTTIITAKVEGKDAYEQENWNALAGGINVDFPAWVDEIIKLRAPDVYESGITAGTLQTKLVEKLPSMKTLLTEAGIDNAEVFAALEAAVNAVAEALEGVPADVKLTFNETETLTAELGAYAVVGIVTDSDHIPAVDAGVLVITLGEADVEFIDVNGSVNKDQRFTFDGTAKEMKVRVTVNDTVVEPTADELTVTYIGVQTNGVVYNSTVAPVHAGVYTVLATYKGENQHVGAAVGVMAIELAESTIDVTGGNVEYNGEGHTADVVVNEGKINADYTLISGGAYVSGDASEVGVDAFHGNVNVDFPKWFDEAMSTVEGFKEGISPAYLVDLITSYRDELVELIPVETMVELGVAQADIDAMIAKLNAYIDQLVALLAKMPADVTLTFNNDVEFTEPGAYLFYGIVTDSDFMPSTDTGLLVIEKMDMKFGAWHNVVPYDGKEHTVYIPNDEITGVEVAPKTDYVQMIVNRENNTVNFVLDSDAEYIINTVERVLGVEIPNEIDIAALRAKLASKGLTVEDFVNVLVGVIDAITEDMEVPTDPEEYAKSTYRDLLNIKEILLALPETGTITFGGALPTEVGEYEFYIIAFSQYYKTQDASAVLFIEPIYAKVSPVANSKVYGDADPELTATVEYYSYIGKEDGLEENVGAWGTVKAYDYNAEKVEAIIVTETEITELPEGAELIYTVVRAEGEDVGEYEMSITEVEANDYMVVDSTATAIFEITPAELTIEVMDAEKVYGKTDPENEAVVTVTKGKVDLEVEVTREAGESVGNYAYDVIYTESDNYIVTEKFGELTIKPADVTITLDNLTKGYDETEPALTYTVEGLVNGDTAEDLNIVVSREQGEDAGEYAITATASNDNYNITVVDGTLIITAVEITSVEVTSTHTYNGTAQTAEVVVKAGDVVLSENDYTVTGNTETNAGNYTVSVTGKGNFSGTLTADWSIAKAEATVTADDKTMVAGNAVPELTAVEEGVVGDALNYTLSVDTDGKTAGTYDIVVNLGENPNYDVTVVNGKLTVEEAVVSVDDTYYTSWADAKDSIKKNSQIKLYADVEYGIDEDGKKVEQKFLANGGNIVIDLNGHDLTFHHTVTVQYGTVLTVTDNSGKEPGTLKTTSGSYPFVINGQSSVNLTKGVAFDGTLQFQNLHSGNQAYFQINGENIIGTSDSLFVVDPATVRMTLKDNYMDLTLVAGHLTLTEDWATKADQKITIKAGTSLTIPEGVTLTLNNTTALTVNPTVTGEGTITGDGTIKGDGTVKVGTQAHLDLVLTKTQIKNIEIAEGIAIDEYTLDREDVFYTGAANLLTDKVAEEIITAGTFDADVTAKCHADYCAQDNGNGTWTVKEHVKVIVPAVAPTCTETGLTEGLKCEHCGKVFVAQEVDPVLGHAYGEWTKVDGDAVDHYRVCANDESHVEKEAHTFKAVVTDPTFEAQGYTTYTCEVCDYSYVDNYVDKLVCALTVDGQKFTSWDEAAPVITAVTKGQTCEIVLYADVTVDNYSFQHEAGTTYNIDLNGNDLIVSTRLGCASQTIVNIKGEGKVVANGEITINADTKLTLAETVDFDGTLTFNGHATMGQLYIGERCWIGKDDTAVFTVTDGALKLKVEEQFKSLDLKRGHLTLNEDLSTKKDQIVTIASDSTSAPSVITIPEGKTLTVDPGTTVEIGRNGYVNGEGTLAVATDEHLKMALATDIANVKLVGDHAGTVELTEAGEVTLDLNGKNMSGANLTVTGTMIIDDSTINPDAEDVDFTAAGKLGTVTVAEGASLTLYAGTYANDVNAYCAEGYIACENDDGTWTVRNDVVAMIIRDGKHLYYGTVAAGLADAKAGNEDEEGETVIVLKDTSDDMLLIRAYTTLDLNGKELTVTSMFANFGDLVDGDGTTTAGTLVIANEKQAMWGHANAQLPIKTADGIKLVAILGFNVDIKNDGKYAFQPKFTPAAHELLLTGKAVSGVSVEVHVHWTKDDAAANSGTQAFVFSDTMVEQFINSFGYKDMQGTPRPEGQYGYGTQFFLILKGTENFSSIEVDAVVASTTEVMFAEPITDTNPNK